MAGAVGDAEQSVSHADRSGDAFRRMATRATHADALHQAGRRAEAEARFREAEQMQAERQPDYPLLYSLQGFQYCDLLLTEAERAAWQVTCSGGLRPPEDGDAHRATLQAVSERAAQTLKWAETASSVAPRHRPRPPHPGPRRALRGDSGGLVTRPLPRAPPARRGRPPPRRHARPPPPRPPHPRLAAVSRRQRTGPESAQSDLDEAWEIAERGPMKLHMADIHLHRARLFFREAQYPWGSPAADLAAARELIEKCGYGRRKEELEDAERAIGGGGA